MSRTSFIGLLAGLALVTASAAAMAAPGYSTANVNMRSGPDTEFPAVEVIPEGEPVEIAGCLGDESWCDVIWGPNRGWVFSEYLAFEYRGDYLALPDIGLRDLRIPIVRFAARDYWDRYYTARPWYRDRVRWYSYNIRPREGWRAPPPGRRVPGWWRQGYRPYAGMRPPVEHWRRMERREERRERRRDWRDDRGGGWRDR